MFLFNKIKKSEDVTEDAGFAFCAFDNASLPMIMTDREMKIFRLNAAAAELARKHADAFRDADREFNADDLIGRDLGFLAGDLSHVRGALSDPHSLPMTIETTVGSSVFKLVFRPAVIGGASAGAIVEWTDITGAGRNTPVVAALNRSQAVIEFTPDGVILSANDIFLAALGYARDDVIGKHHSLFVAPRETGAPAYKEFWAALGRGEFQSGEFRRVTKTGEDLWIQASYNPIVDKDGRVTSVIKFASDITAQKKKSIDDDGKLAAASRSQAMIEFDPSGVILDANENFLSVMGYSLDEIVGKHHSMFADPAEAGSAEYQQFWQKLRAGEFQIAKYRRVGKGGKEIWIRASYNPILDADGKTYKVVKFATDVTQDELNGRKRAQEQETIVTNLAMGLSALAEGRLTVRIETKFADEYDKLRENFNDSVARLQDAMNTVAETANGMANGVDEIARSSDDLSKRTEHQAATLEETAAALDEITATVKQTAESASEANSVVSETNADATKSGEVVREAVSAMGEIEKSSDQISQIIGVIDEIAFQTNLLALNAGVEAARAGDAGRGFAVVAQEVRALAQRSSEAAKEIKGLISDSSEHVKSGVDLVGRTGEALTAIVGRVDSISTLVREIAKSAQEQSTSLGEVNGAMNQMDEVTQQNAAMVEEATAAAQSLGDDASTLRSLLGQFELSSHQAPTSARAVRPETSVAPAKQPEVRRQQSAVENFAAQRPVRQSGGAAAAAVEDDWSEF